MYKYCMYIILYYMYIDVHILHEQYCMYIILYYVNHHVHRAPFSDIERKQEVAESKERRKEIHTFINY